MISESIVHFPIIARLAENIVGCGSVAVFVPTRQRRCRVKLFRVNYGVRIVAYGNYVFARFEFVAVILVCVCVVVVESRKVFYRYFNFNGFFCACFDDIGLFKTYKVASRFFNTAVGVRRRRVNLNYFFAGNRARIGNFYLNGDFTVFVA